MLANHKRTTLVSLVTILTAATILVAIWYFLVCSPKQILITVADLPKETRYASIIVELDDGEMQNMMWLVRAPTVLPFRKAMHPARCSFSLYYGDCEGMGVESEHCVEWKDGQKYGVITMDQQSRWNVYWFRNDEVSITGLSLFRQGTVNLATNQRNAVAVDAARLRDLGLDQVHPPN